MAESLTSQQLAHLSAIGVAIDSGRQPLVLDDGVVELEPSNEEDQDNECRQETGSQAGSREGQRARARRPQAADHAFRSDAVETAHGAGFRILARHYEALVFEEPNGLWVVVQSKPLGYDGPEVFFVIAVPTDLRLSPRAWAFNSKGVKTELMSLKHTNFPDASICAFAHQSWPWPNPDGLLGLVDIYVLWAVRKLHRDYLGWWPGPQLGACAHYRIKEFDPREHCGCGTGKRYGECHYPLDRMVDHQVAKREFERLFSGPYDKRRPPPAVVEFVRTRWREIPVMAEVFSLRPDPSGIIMI